MELDKYQQDLNAAKLMTARPTIQPPESKPLQIPETVFTDPQRPTAPPKPKQGVNTVPAKGALSYIGDVFSLIPGL